MKKPRRSGARFHRRGLPLATTANHECNSTVGCTAQPPGPSPAYALKSPGGTPPARKTHQRPAPESAIAILRASAESQRRGQGSPNKSPATRGAGLGGSILCLAILGLHDPSEMQQAHHPNAQPLRWLMVAAETTAGHRKSPARSGAKLVQTV